MNARYNLVYLSGWEIPVTGECIVISKLKCLDAVQLRLLMIEMGFIYS